MTHDERAKTFRGELRIEQERFCVPPPSCPMCEEMQDRRLAEQFREVEREALAAQTLELRDVAVKARKSLVECAASLAAIVRAGDALRQMARELGAGAYEGGRVLVAWDAATKGISR